MGEGVNGSNGDNSYKAHLNKDFDHTSAEITAFLQRTAAPAAAAQKSTSTQKPGVAYTTPKDLSLDGKKRMLRDLVQNSPNSARFTAIIDGANKNNIDKVDEDLTAAIQQERNKKFKAALKAGKNAHTPKPPQPKKY